jgi:peptidoglycan/LPS O-acetylase OafA/YrhL
MGTRNQSLDILRAIAVLLVMGRHFPYYQLWGRIGWIGVDLFFVLSGFLISGLLFREHTQTGTIGFYRFVVRRCFKIWPAFYFFLFCMALAIVLSRQQFPRNLFIAGAAFYLNYFSLSHQASMPGLSYVLSDTWSLCVEEHFYLILPVLLLLLIKLKQDFSLVPYIFVALASLCLAFRIKNYPIEPYATHLRMDALFAGVTLGYFYQLEPRWFKKLSGSYVLPFVFLTILPALLFPWESRIMQGVGLSCLWAGFSASGLGSYAAGPNATE